MKNILKNIQIIHIIELGIATQLTLGGKGSVWEYMRPNAAFRQ